jgi:hypothetical protein
MVAEAEQVEFQRFSLHQFFIRIILIKSRQNQAVLSLDKDK